MTRPEAVTLGAPDPLIAAGGEHYCSAPSDVVTGMPGPFRCTRAVGHTGRGVPEHVASAPHESRLPVAVGAWIDGSAPRIAERDR